MSDYVLVGLGIGVLAGFLFGVFIVYRISRDGIKLPW